MPITFGSEIYLVQWVLTFIAIVTVLVLLNAGLRQVSQYAKLAREKELQEIKINKNKEKELFISFFVSDK
ncbi:hypothetical protein SD457_24950 [Coprobacillaceae bacterium CR2/5/TPMF4]|nr:hypothetical protein SD457_24950 [Coprobacillaceae bacterium CR2/5/TPMF4]